MHDSQEPSIGSSSQSALNVGAENEEWMKVGSKGPQSEG